MEEEKSLVVYDEKPEETEPAGESPVTAETGADAREEENENKVSPVPEEIEKTEYDFSSDGAQQNAERIAKSAFETMAQRSKRKKKVRTAVTVAVSALLLIASLVVIEIMFFNVSGYEISGDTRYTTEEIAEASGIGEGTNIYAINKSEIEHNIIEKCPFIKSVKIYRSLPSTLRFEIEEEVPAYYFFIADEYFVLSSSMRILDKTGNMGRLLLDYPNMKRLNTQSIKRAVVGERVVFENEGFVTYAEEMLTYFRNSNLWYNITTVDFSNRFSIFFVYEDRLKVIVGDVSDVENKLGIAEKIISTLDLTDSGTINVETNPAYYIMGR